ncbi:IclR family transcriptional regulator [Geosporobacter ferrireducens]|uniref:IclR family transcriptional regulator n=1 Tax=Geosporobacter ferrireducens TaxID=1424294 RepID=A0A1D8GEE3_9FIRM|nr:IclR family transcriptional regulator [Geosporobacter ferrireducens]AOT69283.1 IclR family transcriptional regulator [Geosporobacter ferrireducens]MTI56966.1 IclR family transcriptional regulator [Geosporobacter ferrireducens]
MERTTHRPTERVLNILELLAAHPEGLTLTGIAEAIKAPKSTIFPIIQTMLDRRFIFLDKPTLKYTVGIASFCVGASYSSNKNVLEFINNEIKYIVSEIEETCQMGILDRGSVLYISKVDPDKKIDIRLISHVGKRLPAYCTALGKALLYQFDLEDLKLLYPEGLKAYTKNTITNLEILAQQLNQVKEDNIAQEVEEVTEHLRCLAVPLSNNGETVAALSISIPTFRATEEKLNLAKSLLLSAKKKIETYFAAVNIDVESLTFKNELYR